MPVEIRELVIRAEVADQSDRTASQPAAPMSAADKEKLVQICVERIFEELKRSKEP